MTKAPRINPIGISSHLEGLSQSDANKQLNLMQAAGIHWVRQEFHWNTIEPSLGTWNFSTYDFIVNAILSRGMQIIGLLTQYHVPAWYGTPSNQPPLPADYAAWISVVAARYKGQIPLYEIGNEQNSNGNWYPSASASAYTSLMQAGYAAIKSASPYAKVMSGGMSPTGAISPETFLTQMYANGAKNYMDYVGYHPYSWPASPDFTSFPPSFNELDNLKSIMNSNGDGNKRIIVSEVGWPTHTGSGSTTEANQAIYTGRVYTKIMHESYQYVLIACIYDLVDDGTDTTDPEQNFGLLHTDYTQKAAYATIQSVASDYSTNFFPVSVNGMNWYGLRTFGGPVRFRARYGLRTFGGPVRRVPIPTVALSATLVGTGTLAASSPQLSTSLSATLPGVGVLTPVLSASYSLSPVSLAGVGTLTGAFSLTTALSVTLSGTSTLTGAITAKTALAATFSGVGTLAASSPQLTAALSTTLAGMGTLSSTLSASVSLASVTFAGVGTLSATPSLSTALSVTMAGVGTLNGTLSAGGNVSFAVTLAGVGTLATTLSLATSLSTSLVGTGVLTGTPSLTTALATTLTGTGTFSGTFSLATSLVSTLAGVGVLTGTVSPKTALTSTMAGQGTLAGTASLTAALGTTLAGTGSLAGNIALRTSLAVTIAGQSTLAGTMSLSTALAITLAGTSSLSGTLSLQAVLSITFAAYGTLIGNLSGGALVPLVPNATVYTRGGNAKVYSK